MKITRDEYAKSYVIEVEGECYYWNPPIESRLNQKDGAIEAAPSQESVAYFDAQEHRFYWAKPTKIDAPVSVKVEPIALYTHPAPDAAAQIAKLQAALRQAREALLLTLPKDYAPGLHHQIHNAALAAIDAVLSGAPPSELSDERILELWDDNRYAVIAFARAVLKEGK